MSEAVDTNRLNAAVSQVAENLREELYSDQLTLDAVSKALIDALNVEQNADRKVINLLIKKLSKQLNLEQVSHGDVIEGIATKLPVQVSQEQSIDSWTLSQLAAKCGICKTGETLPDCALSLGEETPGPTEGEEVTLNVVGLLPLFKELIEVLREIRDRLPGYPAEDKGEIPSDQITEEEKASNFYIDATDDLETITDVN